MGFAGWPALCDAPPLTAESNFENLYRYHVRIVLCAITLWTHPPGPLGHIALLNPLAACEDMLSSGYPTAPLRQQRACRYFRHCRIRRRYPEGQGRPRYGAQLPRSAIIDNPVSALPTLFGPKPGRTRRLTQEIPKLNLYCIAFVKNPNLLGKEGCLPRAYVCWV